MLKPRKRPTFSNTQVEAQLQQLHLIDFSSTSASEENLEQLGPILKSIHESRQQEAFLKSLEGFVEAKDAEIEEMCRGNYQDFVSAVDKLLTVRQGTVNLKHRIVELNDEMQQTGKTLVSKKKDLLETRRVGRNLDETVETMQACLRVLDLTTRVSHLISDRKYYAALRSVDDLATTHLPPLLPHAIARHLLDSLPTMRSAVRDAATSELKEWLFHIRNESRTVGRLALDAMDARQRKWRNKRMRDELWSLARVNSAVELVVGEKNEYNVLDNEHIKVDFKPLYQCIHIYESLNALPDLRKSYQADRRSQADLILSQRLSHPSLSALPALLEDVVGFFILERAVLRSTESFRSESEVDDLWEEMCDKIVGVVSEGLRGEEERERFVYVKERVMGFVQTLEGYGFNVQQLNALLLTLFESYSKLLDKHFSKEFERIVMDDENQPMMIESAEDLASTASVCWMLPGVADELKSQNQYPASMAFSAAYPQCCVTIRSFVDLFYQFVDGFPQGHRDIDNLLRTSLDSLLIHNVSDVIRKRLATTHGLPQVAQILINVEHFEIACAELEKVLMALRASQRGGAIQLESVSAFSSTLDAALARVNALVASKLDSFFEMAEVDWTPARGAAQPSAYLVEMVEYLGMVFESILAVLPQRAREKAYKAALEWIARGIMDMLAGPDVDILNDAALQTVSSDLEFLESSARESTVLSASQRTAADIDAFATEPFRQLRLVLQILERDAVGEFMNPAATQSKYAVVEPRNLAGVLAKLSKHGQASAATVPEMERANRRRRELDSLMRVVR